MTIIFGESPLDTAARALDPEAIRKSDTAVAVSSFSLVNSGAMEQLLGVHGKDLAVGRKSLAGSIIGGISETQEVVDYCTTRNIRANVELIRPGCRCSTPPSDGENSKRLSFIY